VALRQRPAVHRDGLGALRARARPDADHDPAYSPESNGLAEGFVHTFKRDYVNVHELRDAETVLAQLSGWIDDYNRQAPHSALGMRSPADYRAMALARCDLTPPCLGNWGADHAQK
jgi:transposase InsO family protein